MLISLIRDFLAARPLGLFVFLSVIVGGIYALSETKKIGKIFDILPCVFWVYFIPMLFATFGFFPAKSPIYDILKDYFLPASLFLLFISASIPDILKLGPKTIFVMLAGTFGIIVGAIVGTLVLFPFFKSGALPQEHIGVVWKGIAALSGSWIGGSANMAAIWESVVSNPQTKVEGQIFSAMVAVDVCVAYPWMAIVIAIAAYQKKIDKWIKSDTSQIEKVNKRMEEISKSEARYLTTSKFLYMITLAFFFALVSNWGGEKLEKFILVYIKSELWRSVISSYSIMIILITLFGLGLSLTRVSKLEGYGASKVGYALLYLVLARIGAKGSLAAVKDFPAYFLMGIVWILVHASFLLAAMKLLKSPVFFAATASQSNIGGPVSAPVVAAAYQPNLAVVGLLMAIMGNILGTFLGLFVVAPLIHIITKIM